MFILRYTCILDMYLHAYVYYSYLSYQSGDEITLGPGAFRVFYDPPQDGRGGLDSYLEYYNGVSVHRAAGIINKPFWYLVTVCTFVHILIEIHIHLF